MTNGLTVIEAFVEPLLHKYVPLPVAVKVVELPLQITAVPLMLTLAAGFTVTARLAVAWQPLPFVTVTEYVVFTEGVTGLAAVVAPLLHA